MKTYKVRTGCEVDGLWRDAGSDISLSEEQARELLPPFGNVLVPVTSSDGTPNDRFNRHQRRDRRRPK